MKERTEILEETFRKLVEEKKFSSLRDLMATMYPADVLNLPCCRAFKRIHCDRMTGECFKRQRRDKLAGVLRHHHIHINALLLQETKDFTCLIYSNAPGHAEDNARFIRFT